MSEASARQSLQEVFALALAHPGRVYFRCTKVPALSAADLTRTRAQVPEKLPLVFQEFVPPPEK